MRIINCRSKCKKKKYFIKSSLKYRCQKKKKKEISLRIVTSEINIPIYNK